MPCPLPVAKMAHYHDHAFAFGGVFFIKLKCRRVEFAPLNNFLFADGEDLKGLDHKIAEVMKEFAADGVNLLFTLAGECIVQVLQNHFFPVTETSKNDIENEIRKQIQQRKWQQRDQVNERQCNIIYQCFQIESVFCENREISIGIDTDIQHSTLLQEILKYIAYNLHPIANLRTDNYARMKFRSLLTLLLFITGSVTAKETCYLFIGTYTDGKPGKGIYVYKFNEENGNLSFVSAGNNITNPSWLTIAPNGKYIYACTESQMPHKGSVSAFSFDSSKGKLTFINKVRSYGENPVYAVVDKNGKWLINGDYEDAGMTPWRINNNGSIGLPGVGMMYLWPGRGGDRQDKAHVHATVFSPTQNFLYMPDLGADKIWIVAFNPDGDNPIDAPQPAKHSIDCEPGSYTVQKQTFSNIFFMFVFAGSKPVFTSL